jgi:hypothetical protein
MVMFAMTVVEGAPVGIRWITAAATGADPKPGSRESKVRSGADAATADVSTTASNSTCARAVVNTQNAPDPSVPTARKLATGAPPA